MSAMALGEAEGSKATRFQDLELIEDLVMIAQCNPCRERRHMHHGEEWSTLQVDETSNVKMVKKFFRCPCAGECENREVTDDEEVAWPFEQPEAK